MRLRSKLLIGAVLAGISLPVLADVNYTQGSGTVIFAFTCFVSKVCPAHVLTNSSGTEIATASNPVRTDPVGTTTQPISAASLPLMTGAATAANQTATQPRNIAQVGGTAVTSATAYGTAPTGNVQGVNAFVTNTNANGQATSANSSPVVIASDQSAVKTSGAINVTPTDCSGSITTGGTAQNALAAQTTLHGLTIMNIDTTEPLWISFTTTAAASTAGSFPLQAATATTFASPGSFTTPNGFGTNHALSVIAATTGHKWSCTWW